MKIFKKALPIAMAASILPITFAASMMSPASSNAEPAPIHHEVVVPLSITEAWDQWTTPTGLQSFFAREAIVEPEVLGEYSIHFFPENTPGTRGAEGMRILAFEPEDRIAFTWNAPPHLPLAREQLALVEITFDEVSENRTRVTLHHDHFGRNADSGAARAYFNAAWLVILARSAYAAINGSVDFDNLPEGLAFRGPSRDELLEMAEQEAAAE